MIQAFWARASAPVHPDDHEVFARADAHSFELDHPPPAYIGNPDAPVVILLANGGPSRPGEFDDPRKVEAFYRGLRTGSFELEETHGSHAIHDWVANKLAVRVNSVAYRSARLSAEPANKALALRLPSVAVHRRWLREVVIPAAMRDERFVIAHRRGAWGLDSRLDASANVVFTPNPVSAYPAKKVVAQAEAWLRDKGFRS